MHKHTFVENLYEEVVNGNLNIYRDLFNNSNIEEVTDSYWKEALKFYFSLPGESRETFFKILKQIEIDTVSNILGIIDGSSSLKGLEDELILTLKKSDEKINDDLQDLFLEIDENNR